MANVIIRKRSSWSREKDCLHKRRKQLSENLKRGMFSKTEMNRGEEGQPEFRKRVQDYDKWRDYNKSRTEEWHRINRQFKKRGEEGRPHSLDDLRSDGKERYD